MSLGALSPDWSLIAERGNVVRKVGGPGAKPAPDLGTGVNMHVE